MIQITEIRYHKNGLFKITLGSRDTLYFTIDTLEMSFPSSIEIVRNVNLFLRKIKLESIKNKDFDDIIYYDEVIYSYDSNDEEEMMKEMFKIL